MPIVINEIEIAVEVTGGNATGATIPAIDTQQIIKECVEQVMQLINDKKER